MEYTVMRGRNAGLFICILLVLATRMTLTEMAASDEKRRCYDWDGSAINNGDQFIPNRDDPCTKCTCDDSYPIMCQAVACHPPDNCMNWVEKESECCAYQCNDPPGLNPDLPGSDNGTLGDGATDDDSITNLGLRLVASTVTSFLVLALLLFMVHRLRQRRLLLAMRRFEAQAHRQQLDESDSDPYIPDTFLGMIECPPYEYPPPPYSSPKPQPRILPGEAPPPYEEIDQSRNNNNNNNNSAAPPANGNRRVSMENQNGRLVQTLERRSESVDRRSNNSCTNVTCPLGSRVTDCWDQSPTPTIPGRVGSNSSNQVTIDSRHCRLNGAVNSEAGSNSLSHASNSSESVVSHNCSVDSEQTLIKKTLAGDNSSLPLNKPKCRKSRQNSKTQTSRKCDGVYNPGADVSSVSRAEPTGSNTSIAKCFSFRANNVGCENSVSPNDRSEEHVNLASTSGVVSAEQNRTARTRTDNQEPNRKSLPPLNLTLEGGVDISGYQKNSHEYLRGIRLSNLMNSPIVGMNVSATESPVGVHTLQRSHSDVSVFSVCSETGEKRTEALRSDCQYPDIPVSAHAMRMETIAQQGEDEGPCGTNAVGGTDRLWLDSECKCCNVTSAADEREISDHDRRATAAVDRVGSNNHSAVDQGTFNKHNRIPAAVEYVESKGHPVVDPGMCNRQNRSSAAADHVESNRHAAVYPGEFNRKNRSSAAVKYDDSNIHAAVNPGMCYRQNKSAVAVDNVESNRSAVIDPGICNRQIMNTAAAEHVESNRHPAVNPGACNSYRSQDINQADRNRQERFPAAVEGIELDRQQAAMGLNLCNQEKPSPKGNRLHKKDKHKSNSSGSNPPPKKPKKSSHPPTGNVQGISDDAPGKPSPNHIRKVVEKKASASNSPAESPGTIRGDPAKKKVNMPTCDSYKQYGFIDEPSFHHDPNEMVQVRLADCDCSEDVSPQSARKHSGKTSCQSKNCISLKQGSKRHQPHCDKIVYCSSPTRQKTARPHSCMYTSVQVDGSPPVDNGLDLPLSSSPRRKSRNPSKSKKRVSYPVFGVDLSRNGLVPSEMDNFSSDKNMKGQSSPVTGQKSPILGLITVRNGPLTSYV